MHPLPLWRRAGEGAGAFSTGLDVDPPAGELGGEAGVLAVLTDGQRELVLRDVSGRRPGVTIDLDAEHLGRAERIGDELTGVIGPGNDVDAFRAELADDAANANAARY